ncbi:hypothetical protein GGI21_001512, partial [Coemansia aciculifera]
MALRLLARLFRAGPLPMTLRAPLQRRSIQFSALRRSAAKDFSDHIEPLALACEKYVGWLDAEGHDYSGAAYVALNSRDKAMRAEAEAILINALRRNPPSTPGALLDRIAEGRATASSSYVKAIIEIMQVYTGEPQESPEYVVAFKPHLLTRDVCTQLLLVIHQTGTQRPDLRIDSRVLLELYSAAQVRKWDIDLLCLEHTAMYLANNSLYGVYRGVRHVSFFSRLRSADDLSLMLPIWRNPLTELELFEVPLAMLWDQARAVLPPKAMRTLENYLLDDPLDTVMEIARLLSDKQHKLSPAFATCLIRALSARERRSDAEWVFARSLEKLDWKHFGTDTALLMSLYYRLKDSSSADAAFGYYRDLWREHWSAISTNMIMPDETSLRAENWRRVHEESAEPRQILHVDALRKLRCRAAGPFYRRALELVGLARIDEAMQLLDDSRHKEFVTIDSAQLSTLIAAMLARGFVDQAYNIHIEFQRSQNTNLEEAVAAQDILFGETTHTFALTSLVTELAKLDDWDRIWCAIGSSSDGLSAYPHIDTVRALLERALETGNTYHAVECAQLIQDIGSRDTQVVLETPGSWIEQTLAKALNLGVHPNTTQSHPFVDVVAALLFKDASASDHVFAKWNATVIGQALTIMSYSFDVDLNGLHGALYHVIGQHVLTKFPDVSTVLQGAAIEVLDTIPESLQSIPSSNKDDVSRGWAGFISAGIVDGSSLKIISTEKGVDLSPSSAFWESTVRAFTCPSGGLKPQVAARYLLLTLKLAFIGEATVSPIAIAAANAVLQANEFPTIDLHTGDLQTEQELDSADDMLRGATPLPNVNDNPIMIQLSKQPPLGGEELATDPPIPVRLSSSLEDKLRWYNYCRQSRKIPALRPLVWLVGELPFSGKQLAMWEHIVDKDLPHYLAVMGQFDKFGKIVQRQYALKVWSVAVQRYAKHKRLEEAVDYYHRIVDAGAYPDSRANAQLLAALVSSKDAPIPALPRDQSGKAKALYGMQPAYVPRAESPADRFLAPTSATQRAELVADVGLGMLYAMLRRKVWPTILFYTVLVSALGKARRVKMLRHIFEVVMPAVLRALPLTLRTKPNLIVLPDLWTMVISEAIKCGHLELAKLWFAEYRMSAMPLFREEGSPYSRIICQDLPPHVRLLRLSRPYYLIPQLARRPSSQDAFADTWYDLEQVEMQLEMDRLRAMDKLPLPYFEAARMLNIYTTVVEHRDMDAAESLAAEILALNSDTKIPWHSRPNGNLDLAYCWKSMVSGYSFQLKQQQLLPNGDDTAVAATKERLAHWFKMWNTATSKHKIVPGDKRHSAAMLSPEQVRF